jgi:uncharacterized protein (DUF302 family)
MTTGQLPYSISGEASLPFAAAIECARRRLGEASYGVLREIDIRAKLEEKLGVEREPYVILDACNPPLAKEGLDLELGVLLPCNVIVYEKEGSTRVAAVELGRMLSDAGNEELDRVREDLARVVEELASS